MEPEVGANHIDRGVGATSEARLVTLQPLIEYYEREMGELPGRLMMAASFLGDLKLMPGWEGQSSEALEAVEKAEALVVSVMIRIINAQSGCNCAQPPKPASDGMGSI
jgi:hypothetical protein